MTPDCITPAQKIFFCQINIRYHAKAYILAKQWLQTYKHTHASIYILAPPDIVFH